MAQLLTATNHHGREETIMPDDVQVSPLAIKDCALASIATGRKAQNLRELRNDLQTIHPGSIYYHFWGGLLRPQFDEPEYNNDFAVWARHGLQDRRLAERLGMIDPADFTNLEDLRRELIDVIEERLDESDHVPWSKMDRQFHFIRSQIVVFDTNIRIVVPEQLAIVVPRLSVGSIFYHFIEARKETGLSATKGVDDFRAWLARFGTRYEDLCGQLAVVDPYLSSLTQLRRNLAGLFREYFQGKRS
jgi:hypothetical protein